MASPKSAFTAKELADLKKRLVDEKAELEEQLATIEEASFAASQSDLTGEVGGYDEENADAGTFTFERERDLSIENNVRDQERRLPNNLNISFNGIESDAIVAALNDDKQDVTVRMQAARQLGTRKAKEATASLVKLLDHTNAAMRFRAATALGRIGDASAVIVFSAW